MYFKEGEPETEEITTGFKTGLLLLVALIVLIGLFPTLVLNWFYF
jgi:NADH-quinone oxidoreductase subunit N